MKKEDMKIGVYMRVGNKSQLENMEEQRKSIIEKNEIENNLELLQIYQLEDNFKNKLNKLDNKIPDNQVKAIIYANDEEYDGKSKKLEQIRKFCKKYKLNIEKEYFDASLVNNYKKKDLTNMLLDAIKGECNTVVLLNSKDMGESPLINTHIINKIFTENGIRFIDIEQRVDTNLDGSLISYENPEYIRFMDFLENEEKKMRNESIKRSKQQKAKARN